MDEKSCRNVRGLNQAQRSHLNHHLDVHKWLMSERAGRDVGLAAAKADFLATHFDRVSREFRADHCTRCCEHRSECPVAPGIDHIPSLEERLKRRPQN